MTCHAIKTHQMHGHDRLPKGNLQEGRALRTIRPLAVYTNHSELKVVSGHYNDDVVW